MDRADRPYRTVRDRDGMEVPKVEGDRLGAPPLALEVRRVTVIDACHHFHQSCGESGLFVLVQQNNNNTLHTNTECNILQYGTNSTYNIAAIKNTTNRINRKL